MKKISLIGLFGLSLSLGIYAVELSEAEKDLGIRSVKGKHGVVSSAHPIASKIGLEILKKGGNAVDAAVGVSFALGLLEPNASGLGGGGYMLVNNKNDQKVYNYYEKVPASLTYSKWEKIKERKSYLEDGTGAIIPGAVDGWLYALEKDGTMKISEILEPIIKVAEEGSEMTPNMADVMADSYAILSSNDEISKIYLNDGLPYMEGEIYKNQDYANTLKLISKHGRDGFYKGSVAKAIMDTNPYITQEDLDNYKTIVQRPVSADYRGYKIVATAPETSGATVIQMLNMMENYDVAKLGEANPELYHLWAETMNLAQKDRSSYIGDPRFENVPAETLISQEFANERVKKIDENKGAGKVGAGKIKKLKEKSTYEYESPSTTHVSIVDKNGMAVSMTNTIGYYFGYGIVPRGTGFPLNNHISNFSYESTNPMNTIEPGKRARTTMAPTFVFDKDGDLELIIGCPGADRIVSTIPFVISNYLDHKMTVQEAINYPRIHKNYGKLYVEGGTSEEVIKYLEEKGHNLKVREKEDIFFGGVHAISVLDNGYYEGGADPRRDGKALGY